MMAQTRQFVNCQAISVALAATHSRRAAHAELSAQRTPLRIVRQLRQDRVRVDPGDRRIADVA